MPKMFVISHPLKKSKFIVRTEAKTQQLTASALPQKPKLNSHFTTSTSSSTTVYNHIPKASHMNQNIFTNNRQLIKRRLKFRFAVVKNCSQVEKKCKKTKDAKSSHRRLNKDQSYACGRWKVDEHKRFVEAIIAYGNDWKQVQRCVKTRSSTQARSHAQKFFVKIKNAKLLKFNLDLSKTSIKMLHDLVSEMSGEEYEKMISALNSVAFERRTEKRSKSNAKSSGTLDNDEEDEDDSNDSDSFINMNYVPLYSKDSDFNMIQGMNVDVDQLMLNQNSCSTNNQSMSIDAKDKEPYSLRPKRNSINSIEGFYHNNIEDREKEFNFALVNEKDYISSFNKTFTMEIDTHNEGIPRSRRMSVEDDFIYNFIKQKP